MATGDWNINTHPELDDNDFVLALCRTVFDPNTKESDKGYQDSLAYYNGFGGKGRTEMLKAWKAAGNNGNYNDPWLYNIPPWAGIVIVPVVAIVAAVLLWKAYGHHLTKSINVSPDSRY